MKRFFKSILPVAALVVLLCSCGADQQRRPLVIISTNDMHAQIGNFARFATAVQQCRDTADVVLVDAGDRWTGNAYVDLVEHYTPMYELMNHLQFDISILGNHEFDRGQAYLAVADRQAKFTTLCANIKSDTVTFVQPIGDTVIVRGGVAMQFVGVVSNYDNGHPSGKDESYEGVTFDDPQAVAAAVKRVESKEPNLMVLISHIGLERDIEFAESEGSAHYDLIIGGHSHDKYEKVVNGKLIGQTGSRLKCIGATTVTVGQGGDISLRYRNISLSDYAEDEAVASMIERYMDNPDLKKPVAQSSAKFNGSAVENMLMEALRTKANAEIGFYNAGGVRIGAIEKGDIPLSILFNLDPFGSKLATATMTTAQMKKFIMAKFNDKVNVGESHTIDILSTTPYEVVRGADGDAVDVRFPKLQANRKYRVAMGNYLFNTYCELEYSAGAESDLLVTDILMEYLTAKGIISPDTTRRQTIR
ncbi:MAG: 5'-nucleotidase C-terminal domain-containing protein [Rikenellaceae bacterium]